MLERIKRLGWARCLTCYSHCRHIAPPGSDSPGLLADRNTSMKKVGGRSRRTDISPRGSYIPSATSDMDGLTGPLKVISVMELHGHSSLNPTESDLSVQARVSILREKKQVKGRTRLHDPMDKETAGI